VALFLLNNNVHGNKNHQEAEEAKPNEYIWKCKKIKKLKTLSSSPSSTRSKPIFRVRDTFV
jgi:hypothetical protein